jgi:Kef-type K+ transport system membrane component KefB
MNLLVVLSLYALMHALRTFEGASVSSGVGTSMALGYLLLTGHFVGRIFSGLRLPKLTGYLATGLAVGPHALGVVNPWMVDHLTLVNGMAIALIALTAGTELEAQKMRPLLRTIAWITVTGVLATAALLAFVVVLLQPQLPFLASMGPLETRAVAAVLGIVMVAQSPAVVVALRDETDADGPVARTVLGVVVIADIVVIVLFALASAVTKSLIGANQDPWVTLGALVWELLGSLAVGGILGWVLALYVDKVRAGTAMFLLTLAFVIAEVGTRLHFDPLLVALGAGIVVRNFTSAGDAVHDSIAQSSLPVYTLFFAVAGMAVDLRAVAAVGLPALVIVAARGAGLLLGSGIGARLGGAPVAVERWAGFGLLPQAGLAIALSLLFSRTFPEFGASAGALTLSVVALNEIFAPVLYRYALQASGEIGVSTIAPRSIEKRAG